MCRGGKVALRDETGVGISEKADGLVFNLKGLGLVALGESAGTNGFYVLGG